MKIKGNMAKASKFTPELFPPPTAENLAKYKSAKLWTRILKLDVFNVKLWILTIKF